MARRICPLGLLVLLCLEGAGALAGDRFDAEERSWWSLQPLRSVAPPPPRATDPAGNPLDAFLLEELAAAELTFSPPATRRVLIRRLYFDALGLPPAPAEVEAFLADDRPGAYERLVDRVLGSPRFGERWTRHWLDIVRYAESDGFRADDYRPQAWRYRDWVVRSLNADKPFARFVTEQIAGDEAFPNDPDAIIATGYLRLWPYEHNQRDVHRQWNEILDDVTDITADAFLGLSYRCARCHDHKFDPILQRDYYRLRAFFAALLPRDDMVAATAAQREEHARRSGEWLAATRELRASLEEIEAPVRARLHRPAIEKFMPRYQELLSRNYDGLSPADRQIYRLAERQLLREEQALANKIPAKEKERWDSLRAELARFDHLASRDLVVTPGVTDVGPVAPPTYLSKADGESPVAPGFPTILDPDEARIEPPAQGRSTGRRSALARWLSAPDNPLSTRVIVNRIWQHHFGHGIVDTPNDFGRQGKLPSHPALLDWLAAELGRAGGSLKHIHRLILTSRAYRQSSDRHDRGDALDPTNRLLWRMNARRLEGESLRDAILAVSGRLDPRVGGPSEDETGRRRSLYVKALRNKRADFLDAFDHPDMFNSCARRNETTTAPQALLLLNSEWAREQAAAFAERVVAEAGARRALDVVETAFAIAFGRGPTEAELGEVLAFLPDEATNDELADFCHVLLNTNEFLYVD